MKFEILNRESLFDDGFGVIRASLQGLKAQVDRQAGIVQNPMLISEEEFAEWWNAQGKMLEEIEKLKHNWMEIHKLVAENRLVEGCQPPPSRFR